MLNKNRNQMNIRGVMVDGVWIDQPMDVKREFFSHFQNRFAAPFHSRIIIDMVFPNTIYMEQQEDLERSVSREELKAVVWECRVDKSPGPDGFTFYFCRQFWASIEKDVFDAVDYFFINGDMPKGCNSSFIALIPKVPAAFIVVLLLIWLLFAIVGEIVLLIISMVIRLGIREDFYVFGILLFFAKVITLFWITLSFFGVFG